MDKPVVKMCANCNRAYPRSKKKCPGCGSKEYELVDLTPPEKRH